PSASGRGYRGKEGHRSRYTKMHGESVECNACQERPMDADKCILIAIDASEASDRAVAYVAQMIHGQHGCRVLLSHVPAPMPPELLEFGGRENPVVEQHTEAALHNAQTAWLAQVRQAAQPVFARAQPRL